ncbi:hypothetical protein [Vacuolonema iberomarrocanum]|uniref:hypothetical protein n=1 Tax=Vacuolonema iberomarrocanum TaxID=3454632 RepID=UPI0019EFE37A|nr:hypothetical protein [filamentous cyanobacterium LEGE 07170]
MVQLGNQRIAGLGLVMGLAIAGCTPTPPTDTPGEASSTQSEVTQTTPMTQSDDPFAEVTAVETYSQDGSSYTFSVTLASPDTGCEQYANWWEVLTVDGELLYRRILVHSHVEEQPFTRSGGPVTIEPDEIVIVRGHMDPAGYGTQAMQGTINDGFEVTTLTPDFAVDLAAAEPQPAGCEY